jgi:hypothetical protein
MMSSGGRRTTDPQHHPRPIGAVQRGFVAQPGFPGGVQLGPGGEGTAVHQPAWRAGWRGGDAFRRAGAARPTVVSRVRIRSVDRTTGRRARGRADACLLLIGRPHTLIKKGGREVVRRGEAGSQLDPVAAVVSGSAAGAGGRPARTIRRRIGACLTSTNLPSV